MIDLARSPLIADAFTPTVGGSERDSPNAQYTIFLWAAFACSCHVRTQADPENASCKWVDGGGGEEILRSAAERKRMTRGGLETVNFARCGSTGGLNSRQQCTHCVALLDTS